MSQEPAAPPPPGVIPDFNHPSGGIHLWLIVTQCICLPLVAFFVITRLYVKLYIQHVFYIEDWMCLISWILATTWFSLHIVSAHGGGGYHQWDIRKNDMVLFLKISYIINILYGPLILTVKLSILFMLARLFAAYRKWIVFIYIFSAILVAYTISTLIVKTFICNPIDAFWLEATNGKCLNVFKVFLADTTFSVITDLVIIALPITLISVLHLSLMKKLRVIVILAAGGLVCIVTIVRLVWVIVYQTSQDRTWTASRTDLVTCAEIAVGIICACLPTVYFLANQRCSLTSLGDSEGRS